jgi:hypothetical protein
MTNEDRKSGSLPDWELQAWRRLRAGMLVELGLGDKKLAKTWQESVRSGSFDADRCAGEILSVGSDRAYEEEAQVLQRASRLQRDLIMTPLLRGVSGAKRKVRGAAKSGLAAVLSQFIVLGIFSLLTFLFMLVMAFKGTEFDPFFQAIIDYIPAMESGDSPSN